MEELLALLGWAVFEVLLVGTGSLVVRLVSLGRWRGERLAGIEGRVHSAAGSLSFVLGARRIVTKTGLLFVGVIFYVLLGATFLVAAGVAA